MKQFQISYNNDVSFYHELDRIKQWKEENPSYLTIFRIYAADLELDHIRHVCAILDKEMPDALYLGSTSNGNILAGALTKSKIILTCTVFERATTKAKLWQIPFSEENIHEEVDKLKQFCDKNSWVGSVELHMTRLGMPVRPFFDEIGSLREDILIYGGGAFTPDPNIITTAVFSKGSDFSDHGIVFVLLGGEDLHAYGMHISGWKPLKRRCTITKADKLILQELDGQPAFDIYQEFLNIEKNDQLVTNTMEFPLFLDYHGTDVLRCALDVYDDNSLLLTSIVPEDTTVRLAYGDFETILDSIRHDGQNIADFQPEAIQVFSCASRRAFWGDDSISDETILFNSVAPTAGFYTGGEFLRIDGFMFEFDVTLVIVGMREGEPKNSDIVSMSDAQIGNADNERVPLIRRFVSFIEASTAEYEELNRKLAISSVTDGLTGLYNRAEIERRIRGSLNERAQQDASGELSLIMLDIDDFKKTNDAYGHQEGDRVIIALADVLRTVMDGVPSALGRWGGEEFMVLLPDSAIDEAMVLAEKLRTEYEAVSFESAGHKTVSVGVVQAKQNEDADALYIRVDKALYAAKANGKNQVVRLD